MALHYILDGYNVIKQVPFLDRLELKASRESLIQFIENRHPQGSENNKVTIVFDGQPGISSYVASATVKVIFSCDESADDKIKHMVAAKDNKRATVVVTNDRAIRYYVRACGAMVLGVEEFLQDPRTGGQGQPGGPGHSASSRRQRMTKAQEEKINKELEQVWLKGKKKKD